MNLNGYYNDGSSNNQSNSSFSPYMTNDSGSNGGKKRPASTQQSMHVTKDGNDGINSLNQPPLKRGRFLSLPEQILALVPESSILNDLQSFEYRLDKILADKKLKMRQLLTDTGIIKRVLRIQIYCEKQTVTSAQSASNAPTPSNDLNSSASTSIAAATNTLPSNMNNNKSYIEENWTMHIQGTLMNENGTEEDLVYGEQFKFTHFIKSMIVELDEELFPTNKSDRIIEWHRTHGFEDCDGFTFTRKVRLANSSMALNQDYPVKILLGIRDDPPLYHVSPLLGELISLSSEDKQAPESITPLLATTPLTFSTSKSKFDQVTSTARYNTPYTLNNILTSIWNYIKLNKLQDVNDKNKIICDDRLKEIFGCTTMNFSSILQLTKQHLLLPEPTQINYNICRTKMGKSFEYHYDVGVTIAKPKHSEVEALLSEKPLAEVQKYDMHIQKALEGIEAHKKKRDFMLGFSQDPVNFIHRLINSQTRDLLLMSNNQELEQKIGRAHV